MPAQQELLAPSMPAQQDAAHSVIVVQLPQLLLL